MNLVKVERYLEQKAVEYQDLANLHAVEGNPPSAQRYDTLAEVARLLAAVVRVGSI